MWIGRQKVLWNKRKLIRATDDRNQIKSKKTAIAWNRLGTAGISV